MNVTIRKRFRRVSVFRILFKNSLYLNYNFPHFRYVKYNNALPYNRINEFIDVFDGFIHKLFNEQTDNGID